jgi:hypothetical protein
MRKPWFRAKKYGWGWGLPLTWQGWIVLIVYSVFIVWDFIRIDASSHSASDTIRPFLIDVVIASCVLILIAALTGEKPKWRWGEKK